MVVNRVCDGSGRVVSRTNFEDKNELRKSCLRHATRPNGVIEWDVFETTLLGHRIPLDFSSDSSSGVGSDSDSDCVFLYSKPRSSQGNEICPFSPFLAERDEEIESGGEMETFSDEVLNATSLYTEVGSINFFRSERDVSFTGHEEDVELLPCGEDENVYTQHPEGGEVYYMYAAVLEEFGVQIPLNDFEMDVIKALNVAPSQIRPNIWAFIRGFEILCKAFEIEPLLGPFLYF